MKKLLMVSTNGDYEVKLLERNKEDEKIKEVLNGTCSDCGKKVKMSGHCNDGEYELFKCEECDSSFGVPALGKVNGVPSWGQM